jgi:general secretion pathway protein K
MNPAAPVSVFDAGNTALGPARAARGAAIIMAMLLAALAATIAATLLWQQQRWINDNGHRRDQVQAKAMAMAGVQWARQIVFETAPANTITHLGQPWALRLPAIPLENGSIAGYIVDAQSRINVNNLSVAVNQASTRSALARLFEMLSLPPTLINAITDWVDADDMVTEPGGAEDAWYLAQPAPGLSANAPIRRSSELLSVRGDNAALFNRLRPYVSALDAPTAINVNTASPEVLAAVANGLDRAGALALVAARQQRPFSSVADFRLRLPRPDITFDDTAIDVRSNWFEVSIEARQGDTVARARALLQRSGSGSEWPTVVWQTVE